MLCTITTTTGWLIIANTHQVHSTASMRMMPPIKNVLHARKRGAHTADNTSTTHNCLYSLQHTHIIIIIISIAHRHNPCKRPRRAQCVEQRTHTTLFTSGLSTKLAEYLIKKKLRCRHFASEREDLCKSGGGGTDGQRLRSVQLVFVNRLRSRIINKRLTINRL